MPSSSGRRCCSLHRGRPTVLAWHTMRKFVVAGLFVAACGSSPDMHPTADGAVPFEAVVASQTQCATLSPLPSGTCSVTAGGAVTLLEGNVLTPDTIYIGGQVAIAQDGDITCAGCHCAVGGETVITCPNASVSPGLINVHDHLTYTQNAPSAPTSERYDDRQQWREGLDGHTPIDPPGGASEDQVRWGELRHLMAGATSTVGAGGEPGLLRNLDSLLGQRGRARADRGRLRHVPARRRQRHAPHRRLQLRRRAQSGRRSRGRRCLRAPHLGRGRRHRPQRVLVRELGDLRHDVARRLERPPHRQDVDDPRGRPARRRLPADGRRRHRHGVVATLEHLALRRHGARDRRGEAGRR